jgi:hypothetical protein
MRVIMTDQEHKRMKDAVSNVGVADGFSKAH